MPTFEGLNDLGNGAVKIPLRPVNVMKLEFLKVSEWSGSCAWMTLIETRRRKKGKRNGEGIPGSN